MAEEKRGKGDKEIPGQSPFLLFPSALFQVFGRRAVECVNSVEKHCAEPARWPDYAGQAERWLSGLKRTPGKREYLKSTVGSNPSLSANFIFHWL